MSSNQPDLTRLDPDGRERPAFIFQYPRHDPQLNRLVDAFERGDFRLVGRGAKTLANTTADTEVQRAALDLLKRTQPHPLVRLFLLSAFLLFTFLVGWSYV